MVAYCMVKRYGVIHGECPNGPKDVTFKRKTAMFWGYSMYKKRGKIREGFLEIPSRISIWSPKGSSPFVALAIRLISRGFEQLKELNWKQLSRSMSWPCSTFAHPYLTYG